MIGVGTKASELAERLVGPEARRRLVVDPHLFHTAAERLTGLGLDQDAVVGAKQ